MANNVFWNTPARNTGTDASALNYVTVPQHDSFIHQLPTGTLDYYKKHVPGNGTRFTGCPSILGWIRQKPTLIMLVEADFS